MGSAPDDKIRFYTDLFRCRTDVYALRWENKRDGRSGWMPAMQGYWRLFCNTNTVGAIAVRCVRGSLSENIAALVRRCSPAAERVSASRPGIVG